MMYARLFGVFAMILASASLIYAQKKESRPEGIEPVSLTEILTKFKFSSRINHTLEKLNGELITAINERRVSFVLDDEISKQIKDAGGSQALIKVIDESLTDKEKVRIREALRLNGIIRKNYNSKSASELRMALAAGKEFIAKFGDDPEYKEFVSWLREQMPNWSTYTNWKKLSISRPLGLTPIPQNHNI